MVKKPSYTNIVVVILVLIFVGSIVKALTWLNEPAFGKALYIEIKANEIVDYKTVLESRPIEVEIEGENYTFREAWFDFCFRKEDVKKLSEFMRQNNYIIAPGLYIINQGYTFDEMKRELKFQKVE